MKLKWWIALFSLRILYSLYLRTSFVPDEYYQGVEPAFKLVFSEGMFPTWEWQPEFQLRSYILIVPYIVLFQLTKVLGLDRTAVVAIGPRVVQTLFSCVGDWYLHRLVSTYVSQFVASTERNCKSESVADYTLFVHTLSWFGLYCGCRTMANTTETVLVIIALSLMLTAHATGRAGSRAYFVAVMASYSRPTALVPLAPAVVLHALRADVDSRRVKDVGTTSTRASSSSSTRANSGLDGDNKTKAAAAMGAAAPPSYRGMRNNVAVLSRHLINGRRLAPSVLALALCVTMDAWGYGHTHWKDALTHSTFVNFIRINVIQGVATEFGTKEWYWYLLKGLPQALGMWAPLAIVGLALRREVCGIRPLPPPLMALSLMGIWVPVVLGLCTSHQELRFLAPALPFMHTLVGWMLYTADHPLPSQPVSEMDGTQQPTPPSSSSSISTSHPNSSDAPGKRRGAPSPTERRAAVAAQLSGRGRGTRQNPSSHRPAWVPAKLGRALLGIFGVSHIALAVYLAGWHQSGPEVALAHIADYISNRHPGAQTEVHLLAPCYSFPGQSFVHIGDRIGTTVMLRAPTCMPVQGRVAGGVGTGTPPTPSPQDEGKQFVKNPQAFWEGKLLQARTSVGENDATRMTCRVDPKKNGLGGGCTALDAKMDTPSSAPPLWREPQYVLTLDGYEPLLVEALENEGFSLLWSVHHAHVNYDLDDPLMHKRVLLYSRDDDADVDETDLD